MGTKNTKATNAETAMAALEQAKRHETACETAQHAALAAQHAARGFSTGVAEQFAIEHRVWTTKRDAVEAKWAHADARENALLAGCGAPEEMGHPKRFAVTELRAALSPLAARKVKLEQEIAEIDTQAKAIVATAKERRDEVAADPSRPPMLGAVAPVPENMFAVLVLVGRHADTGARDESALATVAGWCSWSGGEVPEQLRGKYDELVEAAIVGSAPARRSNQEELVRCNREIDSLETRASEYAEKVAKEDAEREERRKDNEADKVAKDREREREAAKRRVEMERANAELAQKREAGRKLLAGSARGSA